MNEEFNSDQKFSELLENEESNPICVLHMLVPVEARRRAKLAAIASGVSFRKYVTLLLLQAKPLSHE